MVNNRNRNNSNVEPPQEFEKKKKNKKNMQMQFRSCNIFLSIFFIEVLDPLVVWIQKPLFRNPHENICKPNLKILHN